MLGKRYAQLFIDRELATGHHLIKALSGHHQKSFKKPKREIKRLLKNRMRDMGAFNPHARARWFRVLGEKLCRQLGAEPPFFEPSCPVFLLTVLDGHASFDEDGGPLRGPADFDLTDVRKGYRKLLEGLNYVGMIDTALYVSTQRMFQVKRFISYHVHVLVWGIDERKLKRRCEHINEHVRTLFSYTSPARYDLVNDADLLQVIWYSNKTPYYQIQVRKSPKGRFKQWKRSINGVNSVRLYDIGRTWTLKDLAIAGGRGIKILDGTVRQMHD